MKILFIGPRQGNSYKRFRAIKKLYKDTESCFTDNFYGNLLLYKIFHNFSPKLINLYVHYYFKKKIIKKYDLIFINNEAVVAKNTILFLKKKTKKIILYCNDNPFLKRDKKKWLLLKEGLKFFDFIFFEIFSRLKYAKINKLKNCYAVLPQYEKETDKKYLIKKKNKIHNNDIVFVGNWFPERSKFFLDLHKLGVDFKIYGMGWHKDKYVFNILKSKIYNKYVENPEYSKIIQSSKIALCLLSKGNDDDITTRTIEIPAIGTLLLSEKTNTQTKILIENKEAVYFKNVKDCAIKCRKLLANNDLIKKISKAGNYKIKKVLKPEVKKVMKKILNITFSKNKEKKKFIYKFN